MIALHDGELCKIWIDQQSILGWEQCIMVYFIPHGIIMPFRMEDLEPLKEAIISIVDPTIKEPNPLSWSIIEGNRKEKR